jgi:hypothetical protein
VPEASTARAIKTFFEPENKFVILLSIIELV